MAVGSGCRFTTSVRLRIMNRPAGFSAIANRILAAFLRPYQDTVSVTRITLRFRMTQMG
jgi:hypothetical protein